MEKRFKSCLFNTGIYTDIWHTTHTNTHPNTHTHTHTCRCKSPSGINRNQLFLLLSNVAAICVVPLFLFHVSLAFLLAANVNSKSCALGEELKQIVFGGMLMLRLVLNITGLVTYWSVDILPLIKCAMTMMTQTETAFSTETNDSYTFYNQQSRSKCSNIIFFLIWVHSVVTACLHVKDTAGLELFNAFP